MNTKENKTDPTAAEEARRDERERCARLVERHAQNCRECCPDCAAAEGALIRVAELIRKGDQ